MTQALKWEEMLAEGPGLVKSIGMLIARLGLQGKETCCGIKPAEPAKLTLIKLSLVVQALCGPWTIAHQ